MSGWEKANSNSDYITLWFWNLEKDTWLFSVRDNFPRDTRLSLWPLRSLLNIMVYGSKTDLMVQFSSVAQSCPILCDTMDCSRPGLPVYHQLPEFTQTHVHWVGDAIHPSHPLSSPSPPAFYLSQHQVFSNESALRIRWPKYWSFSFSISPSNEHSGLIFFRMDWLDLLAVQGTLKSLLQHHSSKALILWNSDCYSSIINMRAKFSALSLDFCFCMGIA